MSGLPLVSVLIHNGYDLGDGRREVFTDTATENGKLADLLYADDTLVMGESADHVSEYGGAIEKAGAMYGMSLRWKKTQALSVCTEDRISRPDGSLVEENGSLEYLGTLLTADGKVDSGIS